MHPLLQILKNNPALILNVDFDTQLKILAKILASKGAEELSPHELHKLYLPIRRIVQDKYKPLGSSKQLPVLIIKELNNLSKNENIHSYCISKNYSNG